MKTPEMNEIFTFYFNFKIRIASHAALSPLSTPTQATGTPLGIWAIARSASSPLSVPLTGTPITGLSVFDAITPGSAADKPAIAMNTFASLFLMYSVQFIRIAVSRDYLVIMGYLVFVEDFFYLVRNGCIRCGS